MAKAEKFTRWVRKVERVPEEMVELNLTMREAEVLATVLSCTVTGKREGPRGDSDAIGSALVKAGINYRESLAYMLAECRGSAFFREYPS